MLEESSQDYPSSAVFLFFRGLVSRLKVCFSKVITITPSFNNFKAKFSQNEFELAIYQFNNPPLNLIDL